MFTSNKYSHEIAKTLRLAFPVMVAQLGVILMGVTDNILVGQYIGKIGLGAAGIANSLANLLAAVVVGGMSLVAPLISKAKTEGDHLEVNLLFRAAIRVALCCSLAVVLLGIVCYKNFYIFQQTPEINRNAAGFFLVLVISNVFVFCFAAVKQLPDGLSHTSVAMIFTFFGLAVNFIFNVLLINGYYGFPKMGLIGSAVSTLITRILMLAGLLIYIYKSEKINFFLLRKYQSVKTSVKFKKVFKLSMLSGLQYFFEVAAFSSAVVFMGWLGEDQLAAHQIALNISGITYMMASGIAIAGGIRVGEGRGLNSNFNIRLSGNVAFICVAVFMTVMMLLIATCNQFLVGIYINESQVEAWAKKLLIIVALFQLADGFQVVALGTLRGLADVTIPTIITMVAYWGIALPLGYILAFSAKMDAVGIWIGLLVGLSFSGIMLTIRFYKVLRKESEKIK